MPSYKLTYFDIKGGRGESIRLAFHCSGTAFEDERLTGEQFGAKKDSFPFGQLPILTVDNKRVIPQEAAILRYLGLSFGLYPRDQDEAVKVDIALSLADDIYALLMVFFGPEYPGKEVIQKVITEEKIPKFLGYIDRYLENQGTAYSAGNSLTVADLRLYCVLGFMKSGKAAALPTNVADKYPHITKLFKTIDSHEKVASWNKNQA